MASASHAPLPRVVSYAFIAAVGAGGCVEARRDATRRPVPSWGPVVSLVFPRPRGGRAFFLGRSDMGEACERLSQRVARRHRARTPARSRPKKKTKKGEERVIASSR